MYTEVISVFSVFTTNLVLKISLVAFVEFQIERQFRNLECQGKKVIIFVFQAFSWSRYRLNFKIAEWNSEIAVLNSICRGLTALAFPLSKLEHPVQLYIDALHCTSRHDFVKGDLSFLIFNYIKENAFKVQCKPFIF